MADFFKSWVLSLSGIIVFASMCEIILPSGAYKKYINLAIGIVLLLAILSPISDEKIDIGSFPDIESYSNDRTFVKDETAQTEVSRVYKNELCKRMKSDIEKKAGVPFEIKCEISQEEKSFGSIEQVWIIVDAKNGVKINQEAIDILSKDYGVKKERISVKYTT